MAKDRSKTLKKLKEKQKMTKSQATTRKIPKILGNRLGILT